MDRAVLTANCRYCPADFIELAARNLLLMGKSAAPRQDFTPRKKNPVVVHSWILREAYLEELAQKKIPLLRDKKRQNFIVNNKQ